MDAGILNEWRRLIKKILTELAVIPFAGKAPPKAKTVFDESADAYLVPRSQTTPNQPSTTLSSGQSQLDHMIAYDDVIITQPNRHADGQKLVYTVADDKFVLTGTPATGPPPGRPPSRPRWST